MSFLEDEQELMRRMLLDEYEDEVRNVTCNDCGLEPLDLPDDVMVDGQWQNYFTNVDNVWLCNSCLLVGG